MSELKSDEFWGLVKKVILTDSAVMTAHEPFEGRFVKDRNGISWGVAACVPVTRKTNVKAGVLKGEFVVVLVEWNGHKVRKGSVDFTATVKDDSQNEWINFTIDESSADNIIASFQRNLGIS